MTNITFDPLQEGRYDRHGLISWWDQARLAQAHVIVVGAGALGNEVLKLLALLGVGHILVIDFDRISPSNLARMVLFREADVGRPKVEVAVERVRELNPAVDIQGVQGDLRFDLGLGVYRAADLVFGCLDSVNARWALNRKCQQAGVTWIDGGISDFHGQVARYSPGAGACYECNFTPATYARFNRRYSCPYGFLNRQAEDKVPTTAVTTSLTAALQVQEALWVLHGDKDAGLAPGQRLTLYLRPAYRLVTDRLPFNADCLAHDTIPAEIPRLTIPGGECSAAGLIGLAQALAPQAAALELPYDLVTAFTCPACGGRQAVLRPKEQVYQDEARCPACGQMRQPEISSRIELGSPLADLPLAALRLPPAEILAFAGPGGRTYIQVDREEPHSWTAKSS